MSPIYRTRSYIPTLQPSIVTLKTAANAEHQQITWYLNIFITNQPSTDIQFNFATELLFKLFKVEEIHTHPVSGDCDTL